jgi:hypothetical protein
MISGMIGSKMRANVIVMSVAIVRFEKASDLLRKAAKAKGKLDDAEIEKKITSLKDHTERELKHDENIGKQSVFDV